MKDGPLTDLLKEVLTEVARRTRADIGDADASTIIKGQEMGKRAVLVAAAGNHSLLLVGSPEVGKTMLRAVALELGLAKTFEARPCPCGYYNDPRSDCACTAEDIAVHRATWPTADMFIEVPPVPERELSANWKGTTLAAMQAQMAAKLDNTIPVMDETTSTLLRAAVSEQGLSAGARATALAVARTIANLDLSAEIGPSHMMEAINYRIPRC